MGKRSDFARRPQDAYDTPLEAVKPLLGHLPPRTLFVEPCAGKMSLADALESAGHNCAVAMDIAPRHERVREGCALTCGFGMGADYIITNPPWTRSVLHPMIERFSTIAPTWLLFDADWIHTKQASPFMWRLRKIVSVGRVKWIEDSKHTGKDNAAWMLFDAKGTGPAEFFGRAA
ncbi:class I SAM-dependent methyltransferase [Salipiger thiooxidans]|uniref:class I SAM-dependent methyltransferase n=1 Tax=Salipiger thiooxidans TaxID=282683 RepID=UPI001A8DF211|nr:class I SAM-dependent methyltransferase [Salipiger thiooxidans]MBN8189522.1 class I SAM-dependent methyltransferase [Salipiger thiooxidans]